jgi:spore coat polysaccharide biosynthesis predicted glycosyltransferase SpsG
MDGVLTAVRTIGAAALVVDSYAVTARELERARTHVRLLVAMDDTASFPLPAHVVVNSALGVDPPWPDNGTLYLLGARYALLAPEFAEPPVRSHGQVRRILLVLGAATRAPLMAVLAGAARRALPTVSLDAVVGPLGDGPEVMRQALADVGGATLHIVPESIRPLMLDADLAVTAGGVTLCELAATGTPAVGVCLAQNQQTNLVGLDRAGALRFAGFAEDPGLPLAVEGALAELAADAARRRELSARARHLVDGLGARRVAQAMRERLAEAPLIVRNRTC